MEWARRALEQALLPFYVGCRRAEMETIEIKEGLAPNDRNRNDRHSWTDANGRVES